MTYTVQRDARLLGATAVAREGDTGSRVWVSARDAKRLEVWDAGVRVGGAAVGKCGQVVFRDSVSVAVYPPNAQMVAVFATLRAQYVSLNGSQPFGYNSVDVNISSTLIIPVSVVTASFTVYLAAETHAYSGGTPLTGTVTQNGTPSPPTTDTYAIQHYSSGGVLLNTYNLNYSASTVTNNVVITTVFNVTVTPGQYFTFYNNNSDGQSGSALADNSRFGAIFPPLPFASFPGRYEAGVVVSYSLT